MFSFDVKEYLDEGGEGSPKKAGMTDELRAQLFDITDRLNASLDTLVRPAVVRLGSASMIYEINSQITFLT